MRRDSANFQRKIGINFVCKFGGETCLTADLAPRVNGYSPWTLIICLRLGGIIADYAEEMGKGKPGNFRPTSLATISEFRKWKPTQTRALTNSSMACSMVLKLRVMGGLAL